MATNLLVSFCCDCLSCFWQQIYWYHFVATVCRVYGNKFIGIILLRLFVVFLNDLLMTFLYVTISVLLLSRAN